MATLKFSTQFLLSILLALAYKQHLWGPRDARFYLALRGLVGAAAALACYFSVKLMRFADSTTIRAAAPLVAVLCARCLFGRANVCLLEV